MNIKEQYITYGIAHQLVFNEKYALLHINEEQNEIWLERVVDKKTEIIRIINREFDWKNHLRNDIGLLFNKIQSMKHLLRKNIDIHNIYIAKNAPIDEWEMLKKPLKLKQKKPSIQMKVYYLEQMNLETEIQRINSALNTALNVPEFENHSMDVLEGNVYQVKEGFRSMLHQKKAEFQEVKDVFTFGKPMFTYLLLAVNILIYFLLEANGGSENTETLIQFGANFNPLIMEGEWWRLVTSMFLHIGLLHLLMNMLAVYYLGSLIEKIFGSWRFIIIYFLSGIGGSLASFAMSFNVSAGASGALFGLFGALLVFGVVHKKIFFQTMGRNVILLLLFNTIFGFVVPQVDAWAHMGGLVAGFLVAAIVQLPKRKQILFPIGALLLLVVFVGFLLTYGIEKNESSAYIQLTYIEQYIEEDDYEAIVESANIGLENPDDLEAVLLFQRSYGYIGLQEIDLAIKDSEQSIQLQEGDPNPIPEAYYNLALLYYQSDNEKAVDVVIEAVRLKPNDPSFQNLYIEIVGEEP